MANEFPAESAENKIENDFVPLAEAQNGVAAGAEDAELQMDSVAAEIVDKINAEECSRAESILGAMNEAGAAVSAEAQTVSAAEEVQDVSAEGKARPASYAKKGFRYGCYRFVKRTFDIFASGLFLLIFSWLYLILVVVVKCSDWGPVVYRHKRVGKNGKDIYLPKFRSMKKNADKLEDMLTPEQLEQYKREYKLDNDPRITKVGNFLRKTSLDELPNVWAIFTGKISVIGPRPLMREELYEKYGDDAEKLVSVRPGMIGWWAANGRNNTTYESGERQRLELYYVDHCSCLLDLKIIFKTIGGVFRRTGAK